LIEAGGVIKNGGGVVSFGHKGVPLAHGRGALLKQGKARGSSKSCGNQSDQNRGEKHRQGRALPPEFPEEPKNQAAPGRLKRCALVGPRMMAIRSYHPETSGELPKTFTAFIFFSA
jgi:hypothetical protein